MTERMKEIEKMIETVMKKRDLSYKDATEYMLGVATGRLAALWRYDKSVPEGKTSKGILKPASDRKKRAEKVARISTLVFGSGEEAPKKPAKKKPAKKRAAGGEAKKRAKKEHADVTAFVESRTKKKASGAAKKRAKKAEAEIADVAAE